MRILTLDVHFVSCSTTDHTIPMIQNHSINFILMCKHLFFEQIRNGKYGFSSDDGPFGKFCGQTFPDDIQSSDRYLWLHFKSDDNIEYEGFEGVFEFVENKKTSKFIFNN